MIKTVQNVKHSRTQVDHSILMVMNERPIGSLVSWWTVPDRLEPLSWASSWLVQDAITLSQSTASAGKRNWNLTFSFCQHCYYWHILVYCTSHLCRYKLHFEAKRFTLEFDQ